jgi:hypothetical protein
MSDGMKLRVMLVSGLTDDQLLVGLASSLQYSRILHLGDIVA